MIVTSFFVEDDVAVKFVSWMRNYGANLSQYAPRLYKVHSQQQPGTQTFSLQVEVRDEAVADTWNTVVLPNISDELNARFGGKVLLFVSRLKEVKM
jgi:hypothetical protein